MDTVLLKYHQSGMDYLVFDTCKNNIVLDARTVRTICTRNFGLGSEGILAGPIGSGKNVEMKRYRPDGSEAEVNRSEACVFARYLQDAGYREYSRSVIHTEEGDVSLAQQENSGTDECGQPEKVGKLFLSETFISRNHGN